MRHVYLAEDGSGNPHVFGTRRRAQRFIQSQGNYTMDRVQPMSRKAEFWDNPNDPDDQWTIYRVPVR